MTFTEDNTIKGQSQKPLFNLPKSPRGDLLKTNYLVPLGGFGVKSGF